MPDTTVLQDIAVELRRIELADICEVMPYMPKISGLFNAEAHYVQTEQNLQLAADVQVQKLVYEKNAIGNVELSAVYLPGEEGDHHLDAHLTHNNVEVLSQVVSIIPQAMALLMRMLLCRIFRWIWRMALFRIGW